MSLTDIKFKAKKLNYTEGVENPFVEGYYVQTKRFDGELKHCIVTDNATYTIDPSTLKICKDYDYPEYKNPKTSIDHIKQLQEILVQTVIDYINENKLSDIYQVNFHVDGLEGNTSFGEWTPCMDSSIAVFGLQKENNKDFKVRKLIGEYF